MSITWHVLCFIHGRRWSLVPSAWPIIGTNIDGREGVVGWAWLRPRYSASRRRRVGRLAWPALTQRTMKRPFSKGRDQATLYLDNSAWLTFDAATAVMPHHASITAAIAANRLIWRQASAQSCVEQTKATYKLIDKGQYSKNQDNGIWKHEDRKTYWTIEVEGQVIENVEEFVYLGSLVSWDNDCSKYIKL